MGDFYPFSFQHVSMETILWRSRTSAVPKYRIPLVIARAVFNSPQEGTGLLRRVWVLISWSLFCRRIVDRVLETGKNHWDIISPQQGFIFQDSWHVTWVLIFHATDSDTMLHRNKAEKDLIIMFSTVNVKQIMQFGAKGVGIAHKIWVGPDWEQTYLSTLIRNIILA